MLIDTALCQGLFHTATGTAFADILIDGHRETWPVRNKRFRGWLRRCHYQTTGGAASAYNRRYMDICPQGPQFAQEFVNEADRHRFHRRSPPNESRCGYYGPRPTRASGAPRWNTATQACASGSLSASPLTHPCVGVGTMVELAGGLIVGLLT